MKLNFKQILCRVLASLLWILPAALLTITLWAKSTFAVDFDAIINTLTGPLAGSSSSTTISGCKFCIPWFVVIFTVVIAVNVLLRKIEKYHLAKTADAESNIPLNDNPTIDTESQYTNANMAEAANNELAAKKKGAHIKIFLHNIYSKISPKITKLLLVVLGFMFFIGTLFYINSAFQITQYLSSHRQNSNTTVDTSTPVQDDGSFYSENYVDPDDVKISSKNKKKKNLIYIYVESLETSYASKSNGGAQDSTNYMPKLTELANDNISFSNSDKLGGFHSIDGATWTMAAMMAASSGVSFALPVGSNDMSYADKFCSGLTTLGDVLEKQGYTQEFLCGSDANFAGRKKYFEQHGNYQIFDLYTARAKGYVAPDYYDNWWGYEDEYLFEIAKDEASRLASGNTPFNLTMLTVDLHHVGGHACSKCGSEYSTTLENAISCTDDQLAEFISWCKKQNWYDNTTIVISGDHPRMDMELIDGLSRYDRTVYNCFINSSAKPKNGTKKREFTTVDMFPTTLAAMGYSIEGNRLGLGTNVFSSKETLAEKHGYDWLNSQAALTTDWYMKSFAPELLNRKQ